MRHVIILDAAPVRGRFEGCLLTASCQDPNFQEFPLAFAIVDGENDDAWDWFFHKLITVIPDSNDLAFVSKWHSSICAGISQVSFHNKFIYYYSKGYLVGYGKTKL